MSINEQQTFTHDDDNTIDQWDIDLIEALEQCPVTAEEAEIFDTIE